MATFTRTWNAAYEQSPADTDDASEGAQRIREVKTDTQERLVIDHSWAGDGSDGAHKKLTLLEQAADPATVANQGFLYTKDDSGDTELYYKDAGGTVMKITQNGLINPSLLTAAQEPSTLDNAKVDASVATNALTVALKDLAGSDPSAGSPVKIALRDTTVTSGKYNIRSIVAALSVVVPQGATLGYANAETHDVQVFAIDNAGTVELAIGYLTQGLDERILQSTTILNSSSDSANVLYSTTARSSVPIRHIATITIQTGATAGDWSITPTVQEAKSEPTVYPQQILPAILGGRHIENVIVGSYLLAEGIDQTTNATSYTKKGEFLVGIPGTYRAYFRVKAGGVGYQAYAQVYKNGVAQGSAINTLGTSYVYGTTDVTVIAGDLIQIYIRTANSGDTAIGTFRIQVGNASIYHGMHVSYLTF